MIYIYENLKANFFFIAANEFRYKLSHDRTEDAARSSRPKQQAEFYRRMATESAEVVQFWAIEDR